MWGGCLRAIFTKAEAFAFLDQFGILLLALADGSLSSAFSSLVGLKKA